MSKCDRQREWYHAQRRALIRDMGGCCTVCGSRRQLQFHHTRLRTWVAAQVSRWSRIARYKREWLAGVLVLACKPCNQSMGAPRDSEVPF